VTAVFSQETDHEKNWPEWRGPYANGISASTDAPAEWGENKNLKWKTEIPGRGHATPIIWEDQIILLSAIQTDETVTSDTIDDGSSNSWMNPITTDHIHRFVVISVDRKTGKILWKKTLREELPHSRTHSLGSWASNSPVTDGKHIYAYFGSHGLYCLNMKGELIWKKDLGKMTKRMSFGEGSSPILYKDKLIVLRDHEGQSQLHILNKKNGKEIRVIDRNEATTWVSPFIYEYEGKAQLIISATDKILSYDPETFDILWEASGLTRNVIPMPVTYKNIVFLMSGFRGNALLAVDISKASGNINDTESILWTYDKNTPYTPSPLVIDDKLYFLRVNKGFLSCLDAKSGKEYYSIQKTEGINNVFASLVSVNDHIYVTGADGTFVVVKAGATFEIVATNKLEDGFHASPVILDNEIFLRGFKHLYCISSK
jgi:outer membrane protein assembly factor BamB